MEKDEKNTEIMENEPKRKQHWRYCIAGNIVKTHIDSEGILRCGSGAFTGGAKVYLCGRYWTFGHDRITVIGLNRFKYYQANDISPLLIENLRLQRVYKPSVLSLMDDFEFSECWWGNKNSDKREIAAFLQRWKAYYGQGYSGDYSPG